MSLFKSFQEAAQHSKRPLAVLLLEAARLRLSYTHLDFSEYIRFQLYKEDISWEAKQAFAGQKIQPLLEEILTDDYSRFMYIDKVTMYAVLSGYGFPVPKTIATYRSLRPDSIKQLHTQVELMEFLKNKRNTPVYIKRAYGVYGEGNVLVKGISDQHVRLSNGRTESLSDFCASLDDGRGLGWILQEPLTAHDTIQQLTGSANISGLRIHTFLQKNEVKITRAVFKVNSGLKDIDNFEHGASGNMLGAVDLATGRVTRAISGVGIAQQESPMHPITGLKIVGFQLPYWQDVVKLTCEAQKAFPGFICPGWDIALCLDGPKILEVNYFGDMDLPQHSHRQGFLEQEFLALLQERRLAHLLRLRSIGGWRDSTAKRTGRTDYHWTW